MHIAPSTSLINCGVLTSSTTSYDDIVRSWYGLNDRNILSKHIAYHWVNGALLTLQKCCLFFFIAGTAKMLFFLFLCDSAVQGISCLVYLIIYFCCNVKTSTNDAKICAEHLQKADGIELTIILDGYDELPQKLKQRGFLAELIQCKRLPAARKHILYPFSCV